jgi:DNA-binding NarL/FixJ family response regulator
MSDQITEQERRAIDEAIARGAVQIVPQGASSEVGWLWCEKTRKPVSKSVAHLPVGKRKAELDRLQRQQAARNGLAALAKGRTRKRETPADVAERRRQVAILSEDGLTPVQISAQLGVSLQIVRNDRHRMGYTL